MGDEMGERWAVGRKKKKEQNEGGSGRLFGGGSQRYRRMARC